MSRELFEVVHDIEESANRGDPDLLVACCRPDVEWEENTSVYPGLRRRYRGHAELREWFEEAVLELWDDLHFEREEIMDAPGEGVVLGGLLTARGKGSGVETKLRFWSVFWFVDNKVARRQLFLDRAEALEAVGLSE